MLIEEIEKRRQEIRTEGYSMSIGEWMSMYENDEIDIHPEFQRFYRWGIEQKTRLIESIFLGIPIPQIFVSQRNDGVWDVVDGLQRLSTIFEFVGILRDENNNFMPPLKLVSTEYLPSLKSTTWNDGGEQLPQGLKLQFKRSKLTVSIIEKESDPNAKYDLFQRLNTGGSQLTDQEVRNCVLVMLNKQFYDWLVKLAKVDNFIDSTCLSDRYVDESYDIELVLRFLIFAMASKSTLDSIGDVGPFLNEKTRSLAIDENFDYDYWENIFYKTFKEINESLGESAFKRFSKPKGKFLGGFILSAYEAVTAGVAHNIANDELVDDVCATTIDMWDNKVFTKWSGSGITATRRLPRLIPLGHELFSK